MNEKLIGLLVGGATFWLMTILINGLSKASNVPLSLNPLEGISILAFTLGWGLGLSTPVALLGAVALLLVPAALAVWITLGLVRSRRG
jgi:hypothetical protein